MVTPSLKLKCNESVSWQLKIARSKIFWRASRAWIISSFTIDMAWPSAGCFRRPCRGTFALFMTGTFYAMSLKVFCYQVGNRKSLYEFIFVNSCSAFFFFSFFFLQLTDQHGPVAVLCMTAFVSVWHCVGLSLIAMLSCALGCMSMHERGLNNQFACLPAPVFC